VGAWDSLCGGRGSGLGGGLFLGPATVREHLGKRSNQVPIQKILGTLNLIRFPIAFEAIFHGFSRVVGAMTGAYQAGGWPKGRMESDWVGLGPNKPEKAGFLDSAGAGSGAAGVSMPSSNLYLISK